MERPSIAVARHLQQIWDLCDEHIVMINNAGFAIAHTDEERANKEAVPLEECSLHKWLMEQTAKPLPTDTYIARFKDGAWDFESLVAR